MGEDERDGGAGGEQKVEPGNGEILGRLDKVMGRRPRQDSEFFRSQAGIGQNFGETAVG